MNFSGVVPMISRMSFSLFSNWEGLRWLSSKILSRVDSNCSISSGIAASYNSPFSIFSFSVIFVYSSFIKWTPSTLDKRFFKLSIERRMRRVISQSISNIWDTMVGPSSLTIRITSFIRGYSNPKCTSSSTCRSIISFAAMASEAASR